MKRQIAVLICVVFLAMAAVSSAYEGDYMIGPGDVLDISVWKNQDLTKQVIVLPDGSIHFPLVKKIKVEGVTVEELEIKLIAKLKKYVPEPDLSVSVLHVNSMVIYVIGKVNKPGKFPISANVDVLQALAMSGGLNPFAREKEIGIFRKTDGETSIFNFNYDDVSKGKNLEQNIMLRRGDVIVVR